ncbi:BlaI/MecI/CopY family transcriptional regulator [Nocardioides sp. DS6]|uniref:BlaI/MecI/CopY family transcriptional regulator n=1 Tax=Nocardioides eburneus TaxID=3231482 RepID=A0ABV3SWQ2_9ACTN
MLHADSPLTARRITDTLARPGGTGPALTTVLTVLDRLHRAGEVDKARAAGGELLFSAARHEAGSVANDMLKALLRSKDRTGALLSFAGNLSTDDLAVLRDAREPGLRDRRRGGDDQASDTTRCSTTGCSSARAVARR